MDFCSFAVFMSESSAQLSLFIGPPKNESKCAGKQGAVGSDPSDLKDEVSGADWLQLKLSF